MMTEGNFSEVFSSEKTIIEIFKKSGKKRMTRGMLADECRGKIVISPTRLKKVVDILILQGRIKEKRIGNIKCLTLI